MTKAADTRDSSSAAQGLTPTPFRPPGLLPRPRVIYRTKRNALVHDGRVKRLRGIDNLEVWKAFAEEFIAAPSALPADQRAWLIERGFHQDKMSLYALPNDEADEYLSDLQVQLLPFANGRDRAIIENRQLFYQAFSGLMTFSAHLCLVARGKMIPLSEGFDIQHVGGGRLWAFPLDQSKGAPFAIEPAKRMILKAGETRPYADLQSELRSAGDDLVLVRDPVDTASFSERLRIVVVRDVKRFSPRIIAAVQSLGTTGSDVFDTVTGGAISARVDLETGSFDRAVALVDGRPMPIDRHPDTGVAIVGRSARHWWAATRAIESALLKLPLFSIAQFSFRTNGEGPVLLDATARIEAAEFQVHGPLMDGDVARGFLREYGL